VSNFNEARKWLLVAICFENPLSQIPIIEEMTRIFFPKFHEMWPIGIPLVDAPTKLPCLIQYFVFTFMPQSSTKSSNLALLASLSTVVNPNLMINLSNHRSNIII
jgi:hypothetical protein